MVTPWDEDRTATHEGSLQLERCILGRHIEGRERRPDALGVVVSLEREENTPGQRRVTARSPSGQRRVTAGSPSGQRRVTAQQRSSSGLTMVSMTTVRFPLPSVSAT